MTTSIKDASGSTVTRQTLDDIDKGSGATGSGTLRLVKATDSPDIALVGGVTETAPASDTASSGLNGRLQRIAQRLTTLLVLPTALGAQGGLKVEGVASGTAQPVSLATLPTLAAGTNNIGDVDVLTLPTLPAGTNNIGDVDVLTLPALPAGTNNIGDVDVLTLPALVAGEAHVGEIGGALATPSATFTRPADVSQYGVGDLVANSTTAGSVTPLSWTASRVAAGSFLVRRVRLRKSGTTLTAATFRLHLYGVTPATITNGDNGAFSTSFSSYLGAIDLDMAGTNGRAFTDVGMVIGAPNVGSEINVKLASGSTLFGLLEARAAYTPVSAEVFTAELEVLQN